jgi:hypothetical protein
LACPPSCAILCGVPPLTRLFVRTALLQLVLALGLAVAVALRQVVELPLAAAFLGPAQLHLVTVGWLTQLIFGVVYWIFPLAPGDDPRGPRRHDRLAWAAYYLLNTGLLARLVAEPLQAAEPTVVASAALVGSAVAQWLAAVAFAVYTWPRVFVRER